VPEGVTGLLITGFLGGFIFALDIFSSENQFFAIVSKWMDWSRKKSGVPRNLLVLSAIKGYILQTLLLAEAVLLPRCCRDHAANAA
jgi:hypothetical protein